MNGGGWVRVLVAAVVLLVIAAVAGGLALVGSPEQARVEKFDRKRLSDLRQLAHGINLYWARHQALPADTSSLKEELPDAVDLLDPETHAPYPYRVIDENRFEVCATFSTSCQDDNGRCADWRGEYDARIQVHQAGEVCFQLSPIEAK